MTPKQREVYDFLSRWINAKGYPPSYREMKVAFNFKSMSQICQILDRLEASGHIRRDPRHARSIEVVNPRAVKLHPEVLELTDNYARLRGISRESATNQLLRGALVGLE